MELLREYFPSADAALISSVLSSRSHDVDDAMAVLCQMGFLMVGSEHCGDVSNSLTTKKDGTNGLARVKRKRDRSPSETHVEYICAKLSCNQHRNMARIEDDSAVTHQVAKPGDPTPGPEVVLDLTMDSVDQSPVKDMVRSHRALLAEGSLSKTPSPVDLSPLKMLVDMFPEARRDTLLDCLEQCEGGVDEAAAAYLRTAAKDTEDKVEMLAPPAILSRHFSDPSSHSHVGASAVSVPTAAFVCSADADKDATSLKERLPRMTVHDLKTHLRERGLSCGGKKADLFARLAAALDGRAPPAPFPRKKPLPPRYPVPQLQAPPKGLHDVRIDDRLPAQSLLCMRSAAEAAKHIASTAAGPHSASCFQAMVEREQKHWDDYVVFYHSYSIAAVLYEVQAVIARAIYDLPVDFAPLPRLLRKPFDVRPSLDLLMEDFIKMTGQDHNPAFRSVAISVSCSLFGFGSEAPPLTCFQMGYSCNDLSLRGALEEILRACGLRDEPGPQGVAAVADAVAEVSARYGLGVGYYSSARLGMPYLPAPGHAAGGGHMLQIFVRKDVVDSLAYRSKPYGVPIPDVNPISAFLRGAGAGAAGIGSHNGPCNGQARLFAHPAVLTDPRRGIVYHYCAAAAYMQSDPAARGSRAAYLGELQAALAPIIGSLDGLGRALRCVEGRPEPAGGAGGRGV